MQILCTPTEDANGEANEGDGWLAGFYQGQVYFPALGRIYRGAWSLLWRPMRRLERVLIFASSLSSNAKWIPHMHPLLEADAYCYSTFRDAFLPLRSRMRPLLEKALVYYMWRLLTLVEDIVAASHFFWTL